MRLKKQTFHSIYYKTYYTDYKEIENDGRLRIFPNRHEYL